MIKPLEFNRILLTWICLHPADDSTSTSRRWSHRLFAFLVFMLNLTAALATLLFLLANRSENLKDDIYAFAITICYFAANVAMILEYSFKHTVIAVFEQLTEIYDTSKYDKCTDFRKEFFYFYIFILLSFLLDLVVSDHESFRYLEQANKRNEQIFARYWKYLIGVGTYGMFFCVATITFTICLYSHGSFDRSLVFVLYNYM